MLRNIKQLFDENKPKQQGNAKPVLLLVLDGFGTAPPSEGNAITKAKTPNIDSYIRNYPSGELIASGESVGLPANEVGNTEVGHLTMGVGRVIYQDLKRISMSIEDGSFYENRAFVGAARHVRENNSKLHIMGLLGSGGVHSSKKHLYALLNFCKREGLKKVYLHIFTDGRDSPPQEGARLVKELEEHLKDTGLGKIATISGRYYAMDRDRRWDRTEKAYKAMVLGMGKKATSASSAIEKYYSESITDEFIEPTIIVEEKVQKQSQQSAKQVAEEASGHPIALIEDNDAVIFYNFRIDRPKQLTMAFVLKDFENMRAFEFGYDPEKRREMGEVKFSETFNREKVSQNIFFVTMTEYQEGLPVSAVAYEPQVVMDSLPDVISENGLQQLHMAESEKERFVKYYFRGMKEDPVQGEEDVIVPSPKVATYDKKPEMSLAKLVPEFNKRILTKKYHFAVMNFANPDMVAHSGNLKATIKAIEYVDRWVGEVVNAVLSVDGTVIITADHGNAEELLTYPTKSYFFTTDKGVVNTDHSNNPVPVVIIDKRFAGKPVKLPQKALSDLAPTILDLMGLQKSPGMTGESLVLYIK